MSSREDNVIFSSLLLILDAELLTANIMVLRCASKMNDWEEEVTVADVDDMIDEILLVIMRHLNVESERHGQHADK